MCIYDRLDERAMQKNHKQKHIEMCIYDRLDKSVYQNRTTAAYRQGQREDNRKTAQSDQEYSQDSQDSQDNLATRP